MEPVENMRIEKSDPALNHRSRTSKLFLLTYERIILCGNLVDLEVKLIRFIVVEASASKPAFTCMGYHCRLIHALPFLQPNPQRQLNQLAI